MVLARAGSRRIGPSTSSARTSTQIVTAEQGVVQSTVTGSGNIQAGTDLDVNFQTAGPSAVDVHVGQHVNKGQLFATLDSRSAQLALDQAEQIHRRRGPAGSAGIAAHRTSTGPSTGGSLEVTTPARARATDDSRHRQLHSTTTSAASIASAQAAADSASRQTSIRADGAQQHGTPYAPNSSARSVARASVSPSGDTVSAGTTGSASGTSRRSSGTPDSRGLPPTAAFSTGPRRGVSARLLQFRPPRRRAAPARRSPRSSTRAR